MGNEKCGEDRVMTNLILWLIFGLVLYGVYLLMVDSDPQDIPCDECNADIGEPCRPYCIGADSL